MASDARRRYDCRGDDPEFAGVEWVQAILNEPGVRYEEEIPRSFTTQMLVKNDLFNNTLANANGMKARFTIRRPSNEPSAQTGSELDFIIAVGPGVDGATGRAHGGLLAMIMDHLLGMCAVHEASKHSPPATATLTVDYVSPVNTPSVLLARAWMTELTGRKIWCKGTVEDGRGKIFATAKALYVVSKPPRSDKAAL